MCSFVWLVIRLLHKSTSLIRFDWSRSDRLTDGRNLCFMNTWNQIIVLKYYTHSKYIFNKQNILLRLHNFLCTVRLFCVSIPAKVQRTRGFREQYVLGESAQGWWRSVIRDIPSSVYITFALASNVESFYYS